MRRPDEISTKPDVRRSVAEKIAEWLIRCSEKRPVLRAFILSFVKFSMTDMRYNISGKTFVLIGIACIAISLLGIAGWTDGKEVQILLLGTTIIILEVWLSRKRHRILLDMYGKLHGGITEWRNMVFDIRESYLSTLHSILENELQGIRIYGRYKGRSGDTKETERTTHGHTRQWENRSGKCLCAICWIWSDGEKEVRLEYRRAPGNIYASRFFQTKGLAGGRHNRLRTLVDCEEWSCEPRFGWVCRLGIFKITAVAALVVTIVLWGGREAAVTIWEMDATSNGIMSNLRWSFLEGVMAVLVAIVAILARRYYFPAGVFRVDEENDTHRERERAQYRAIRWFAATLAALLITIATPHLIDTCTATEDRSTMVGTYLRQTSMCRFIRSYTTLTEQPQMPTENVNWFGYKLHEKFGHVVASRREDRPGLV